MGTIGYGRKVREDATTVSYVFGADPDAIEGVLVIPVEDPESWSVEGAPERPARARSVLGKAYRLYCRDGTWPIDASFYS